MGTRNKDVIAKGIYNVGFNYYSIRYYDGLDDDWQSNPTVYAC